MCIISVLSLLLISLFILYVCSISTGNKNTDIFLFVMYMIIQVFLILDTITLSYLFHRYLKEKYSIRTQSKESETGTSRSKTNE